MVEDKINLQWNKFIGQFFMCGLAFLCAVFSSHKIFGAQDEHHAIAKTVFGAPIGAILIMGTFLIALWMLRVPYRKDMFERRLRNWSMTYAAIMVFTISVAANIGFQKNHFGEFIITPYIMPSLWLLCYLVYAQYTRYCIANGRRNSFLDGSGC